MTTANVALDAILIDPRARTIEGVTVTGPDSYHAIRKGVHPDEAGLIDHVSLGRMNDLEVSGWVDDEGLLKDWDEQQFFRLREDMQPMAGRMLILMTDETGTSVSLPEGRMRAYMLYMLRRDVQWMEPKDVRVPAPTFQPMNDRMEPEGTPTPLARDGRTEWTYESQP